VLNQRDLFYGALVASKKSRRTSSKTRASKCKKAANKPKLHERLLGFGRNLRTLRRPFRMSTENLAEEANLSVNEVSAIERGEKNPRLSTVLALAQGLRVWPDVLLDAVFRKKEAVDVASRAFRDLLDLRTPEEKADMTRHLHALLGDSVTPEERADVLRRLHAALAKQSDKK
jgi:transcriptional regulator with XRE-family HTH domain